MKKISVEISHKTIIFTLILLVTMWLLYQIKDVLFGFFIALILVGALNPTVASIEKHGLPRWLAILFLYVILLLFIACVLAGLVPPLVQQVGELGRTIPSIAEKLGFLSLPPDVIASQVKDLIALPSGVLRLTVSLFSNTVSILAILVVTFYALLEHRNLDKYLFDLFGHKGEKRGKKVIRNIEKALGDWVRAEAILMLFVGTLSYLGFLLLGLEFALPLALLAGLLEILPNIGPTLAAIPAIMIGLFTSPLLGLAILAWCFLVQQIENNLLVPQVMKNTVGINPVITLLSLAIGFRLAGVGGAVLAIPIYLTIRTIVFEFVFSSEKRG